MPTEKYRFIPEGYEPHNLLNRAPMTYNAFLKCLDKYCMQHAERPQRVSMNEFTLAILAESIPLALRPSLPSSEIQIVSIAGIDIEIDNKLPDHEVKFRAGSSEQSSRDTQFAVTASPYLKYLEKRIAGIHPDEWTPTKVAKCRQDITAQFLYDFTLHIVSNVAPIDLERLTMEEIVARIPDMTKWPKEETT